MQSFQPNPNKSLYNVIFAAKNAKSLGAKKVILVAPYLGFMRQDKRFKAGEAISSKIMADLLNNTIDKLITIDPHIHRYKSLKDIFKISAKYITANPLLADYVKKHIKNPLIIGPDWESYQWALSVAKNVNCDATCFKKHRFSSFKVKVEMVKQVEIKGKNVVIVDDIISTGKTIIGAAKIAKRLGAKSITAIGVHGLFAGNALENLKKHKIKVVSTNTILSKKSKIDVTSLIKKQINKKK